MIVHEEQPGPVETPVSARLELVSVTKQLGGRAVLQDICLKVALGETVGLLGRDGAGKTTCFHTILGLLQPDFGRVLLDGIDITRLPTYRRALLGISYLPQEPSVFRGMTVEQNVAAFLELSEPDPAARADRLEELLADFQLTRLRSRAATTLSGGERRRCEVARALASAPSIILMDEPFAGIDPMAITSIQRLIRQLKTRGIGMLITDYHMREMLDIIDRAYVLHEGRVIFSGDPQALMSDPGVKHLFLGEQFAL